MNYGRTGTERKLRELTSSRTKALSKAKIAILQVILLVMAVAVILGGCAFYGMVRSIIDNSPKIGSIDVTPMGAASTVYDARGGKIETLIRSGSNRHPVSYNQIPKHLINAVIAREDVRFWTHTGVDLKGILRAAVTGLVHGDFTQGASTITQQLIKNSVFDGGMEKGLGAKLERKLQEQYLAIQLEKRMSKEEILTNYLNTINLGSSTLGVQAAATRYFNKSVSDLTLSESAVLAAITKNPTALNPITHPDANAVRRKLVLSDMLEQEMISREQYDEALADDVYTRIAAVNTENEQESSIYSYFVDSTIRAVINDLVEVRGYTQTQASALVYSGGLHIYTTMDPNIQQIVDEEISKPENYPKAVTEYGFTCSFTVLHPDGTSNSYRTADVRSYFRAAKNAPAFKLIFPTLEELNACVEEFKASILGEGDKLVTNYVDITLQPQASFIVIDQHNGYVKAVAGGRGEKTANLSLNRATQSTRQPGSTFKVLAAFAPAIDAQGATLASVYYDEPYAVGEKIFHNYWGDYYVGWSNLRQACRFSMNVVTTKCLMNTVTPKLGYDYLQRFGITTLVDNYTLADGSVTTDIGSSLALGGITLGVTNEELTAAYATIANMGIHYDPVYYTHVTDRDGILLLDNSRPSGRQVLKDTTAFLLTSAMQETMQKGSYPGREGAFSSTGYIARPANITTAGKSGTTTANHDVWFVGFSPYYTAGIWSGYDENKTLNLSNSYHKRIWKAVMTRIHENLEDKPFETPSTGIVTAHICAKSGKLAIPGVCDHDPRGAGFVYDEVFLSGTEPTEFCDCHVAVTICGESGMPAGEYCPEENCQIRVYLNVADGLSLNTDDGRLILPAGFMDELCTIHGEPEPETDSEDNTWEDYEDDYQILPGEGDSP